MISEYNDKKISFIMCSNDSIYSSECELHIRDLEVPAGYEVEVLIVTDAKSMASGYNEGMNSTDAKYKVYLHQDVLIRNKNFLYDIIGFFNKDESIGMIGMVGTPTLPDSGIMWDGDTETRVGGVYADTVFSAKDALIGDFSEEFFEVQVADGCLLATQYDIPWREDIFDGWHFYDCSQSMEFQRKGYKVVVPHMDKPWCFHDNDVQYLNEDYHRYRKVFITEYM